MKKYDIAIIGGGMVGAALASALKNTSLQIALIDATPIHSVEDHRLIALNFASCRLFDKLGIWKTLSSHAAAIHEVHVSNQGRFGSTRLTAKEMNIAELGHVVPAKEINTALYADLQNAINVTQLQPAKLLQLTQHGTHVAATLETPNGTELIEASIVIGADGTHSSVRSILNIPAEVTDYQQKALVTITHLQRSHKQIAYERFISSGAIAMLPLTDQRVATIWSDEAEIIDNLLKLSDDAFLALLQKQFGYRLGKLLKTEARFVYPLKRVRAKEQIHQRVILIGNAAHTLHPVAAQGLNLALYEVSLLAEHLQKQTHGNVVMPDIHQALQKQNVSLNLSHWLTKLFTADLFGVNMAKQLGMVGLDIFSSAKKTFVKKVIGNLTI